MTSEIIRLHDDFWDGFHPDHRADLLKSGLSVATVKAAGIYSARPRDIPKLLGYSPKHLESALVFPYPNDPSFCRIKVFPVPTEPHAPRYLQRKHSGVRLYLPPLAAEVLTDPAIPLHWTEGEKKALKACQEGLACGALGGLWNWIEENRGVAGLDDIAHVNRREPFYPDADVWARPDLLKAVYAFLRELEARGAQPLTGVLPMTAGVQKLDEFLLQRTTDDLQALSHIRRDHKTFSGLAKWWQGWRGKKLGTPKAKTTTQGQAIRNRHGQLISCQHNALLWLATHHRPEHTGLDTFRQMILFDGTPLTDDLTIEIVRQMEDQLRMPWTNTHVYNALVSLGNQHPFSSLTRWLDTLSWDGKKRLNYFFANMYGAEVSDYTAACATVLFLSAVARAYDPGCKADVCVTLIGPQGIGKSRGVEALVPDPAWYTDDLGGDLNDKKASESLQGKWLVEFSDFARINRSTIEVVKSFLSRRFDRYRPPWGRVARDFPRQCTFIGTTNNPIPLQDLENRRFMPVHCPADLGDIASIRDQLWAEAVHRYRQGDHWWIEDRSILATVKDRQEDARQHDEWEEILRTALLGRTRTTLVEAADCLGFKPYQLDRSNQTRLGLVLRALTFVGKREGSGARERYYERAL